MERAWTAMYGEDGVVKVKQFDTYSLAVDYLKDYDEVVGIVTTAFFNAVKGVFMQEPS